MIILSFTAHVFYFPDATAYLGNKQKNIIPQKSKFQIFNFYFDTKESEKLLTKKLCNEDFFCFMYFEIFQDNVSKQEA